MLSLRRSVGTAVAGGLLALTSAATVSGSDGVAHRVATTDDPQPEGEPDLDATFIYAYPITVSRLDPHRASISQDGTTLFPAYDRLVHLAPDGELIPGLAESWEFSEDGLSLTLHVREGVTFHDGATLDAEGVKANFDRAMGIEGSSVQTDLGAIEAVTVVDPMTVELTLSTPNASLIGALADRAGIVVSPQAIADGVDLDQEMVGAGPFRMVSHDAGNTTVYERFDEYWDTEHVAQVAQLEIRVLADSVARLNALRSGQINATTLSANQVPEVENDPTILLQTQSELQYFYIVQNRARAGQDDLALRQAMLHGLDREGICESLLFGYCQVTDQPFPPGYYAYNESIDQLLYPYDPERARELMAEAGVESLELSMLTPAGLPTYPEVGQAIQAQWAELGINVELLPAQPAQLGEQMFANEEADSMLASWGGRPDPGMTLNQRTSAEAFANPGGHTTPEMTDILERAAVAIDPAEREPILQEGSAEVAESILEMVLFFPEVPYVTNTNVRFTPYLTSKPEFRDVAIVSG